MEDKKLIHILTEKMRLASENMKYEEAGRTRDVILALKGAIEKQKAVKHGGGDQDAIGIAASGEVAVICLLKVRRGLLKDKKVHASKGLAGNESEILTEFILQHYTDGPNIPPQILLSHRLESMTEIAAILTDRKETRVTFAIPKKGDRLRLTELAVKNAVEIISSGAKDDVSAVLERMTAKLRLKSVPRTIECIDISNLSGREAVGSLVAFEDGVPKKSAYRIYNIRTLSTPNDYAMIAEVVERRYHPDMVKNVRPDPDLILIDGGKGQLGMAKRALEEQGVSIPVASIAKGKGAPDEIFIVGRKNPVKLKKGSKELLLLMRIRDEAHRFGINAHRKRHIKKFMR